MSVEVATILLFAALIVCIFAGAPVAFALGGTGIALGYVFIGPKVGVLVALNTYSMMTNFVLVAIPLFIFMGNVLERSRLADDLYTTMQAWLGPVRGGLAIGTVVMTTIFSALTGVSAAATISTGIVALPSMLSRKYDQRLAVGSIAAGGALGILIPPSVIMIVYAILTSQSVGRMFAGGVVPGLLLSGLFMLYIALRCLVQPHLGPGLPKDQRYSWEAKFVALKGVVLPILLVIGVLGAMFSGAATPSEAAAVGAFGSIIAAAVNRRLNWEVLREAAFRTIRFTAMVLWITVAAVVFSAIYAAIGASELITEILSSVPFGKWGILAAMIAVWFVLGMLMDSLGILLLTMPVFAPVAMAQGFDMVWFGVLFVINMEMAYLTPPFGFNLFYMRGIAPKHISMGEIYLSVLPFIALQFVLILLVIFFDSLILWFPELIFGIN